MRSARSIVAAALAALVAAFAVPAAADAGKRRVPRGWLGVTLNTRLVAHHGRLDRELRRMSRDGVERVRVAVYWSHLEPYARRSRIPKRNRHLFNRKVDGVPTNYHDLDALVRAAAKHGLPLAPVVLDAPRWASDDNSRVAGSILVPRKPDAYANLMAALVRRYGPHGAFWHGHRHLKRRPIRSWQIWNEVSNQWYWDNTWETSYPQLLKASYDAIKAVDPGAQVIMAGLNTGGAGQASGSLPSWTALDRIYDGLDRQGLGRPFDATAAHIYTHSVNDALRVVQETRKVMDKHGDDRPIDVTELAWPASKGKLRDEKGRPRRFFAETNKRGMARRLARGILAMASHRRQLGIGEVDWYQWISSYYGTSDAFSYSGLRRARKHSIRNMPAMKSFRRVASRLEGRKLRR